MTHEKQTNDSRGPISWMAGHTVAANLVMLACIVGGGISLRRIKQEVFPEISRGTITVSVAYPGASPEEVESGILLSIEEVVRGLDGVDEITSVANEGSGTITVELLVGEDEQSIAQDIRSEVDRIRTFPEDAEEPRVNVSTRRREVLSVVLYGDVPDTVLHQLGERVRDQLMQEPNIRHEGLTLWQKMQRRWRRPPTKLTQVELTGLPRLEIGIEVPQENLRRYGLTLEQVARGLSASSVDLPGGGLKTDTGEILLRVKERRDYGREFARLPVITTADGSEILLGDIARIDDGFEDADQYTRFNGKPAVTLEVYRVGDETPIQVSEAVYRQLEEIEPLLPPGVHTTVSRDRADIYRQRVQLLVRNGAIGLVLVLMLLGLFLEVRLAFWVMMGIPISFLGSFLLLPTVGVTLNMISLFAYIVALGIVVDDAIVVGENVYHHHQEGMPFVQAAVVGAKEVCVPVTFSILTNIVTFWPLYVLPGTMGKIFRMIPIVVSIVFMISLVECLYVLPAHLGHQRDRKRHGLMGWLHGRQQAFSHGFRWWVRSCFGPFLAFTLRHRYLTVATAASILIVTVGYARSGRMGFQLFPVIESDYSDARVVMPYGTPVAKTDAIMVRLLEGAQKVLDESGHPELVKSVLGEIGSGGSHMCRVRVELAEPEIRDKIMSTDEFTQRWRKVVGEIAGVEYMRFASDSGGPGSRGRPLTVELSHRNIDVLEKASRELAESIATYPLVKDVDDGFQPGKQQLDFALKPEGKSLGLTARDVARQVRNSFYGSEVVRQQRGRSEIRVRVRLPEDERSREQTIEDLLIRTPAGTDVPLREVAEIRRGRAYTAIDRRNGRRVVQVSADVTPRNKTGEVIADLRMGALPQLMGKYRGLTASFEGHQADMRESLGSLKVTFVLAMLAIYALLAIPFRSYLQPLIVMVSIPFGVVGAILGHLIMGYSLCLPSMFGIVALSGVVVNDSLVMIDFANRIRREREMSGFDCIHNAAIQRFRPILLTTLTTFGGLAPMIFETSRQAKFLIPMALSLGYGLLFATSIILVLVPSLYVVTEDVRRLFMGPRRA